MPLLLRRTGLRLVLVLSLVASAYLTVPAVAPLLLAPARADAVSGAYSLGGGLGGSVDPRTGQFSTSVPLLDVPSRGGSGVSLSLGWSQSRAGSGLDRYGWGAGWGIGTTFVDPQDGITVYPADGGAYAYDSDFTSGLKNYVMRDLTFSVGGGSGPCPGGSGSTSFTLAYDDGRTDCFDSDGNLTARVDRFGNTTTLTYTQLSDTQWQPATITDAYGLVTTFTYGDDQDGDPQVSIASPKRSDGIVPTTVVGFDSDNRVQFVTDPTGSTAQFLYTDVPGTDTQYLGTVVGPSGAETAVTYQQVTNSNAGPLLAVDTLAVTDSDGNPLVPTRTFSMDPAGNGGHNYTGYPTYSLATTDALFASGDDQYQYSTEITDDETSTVSTYDSEHRMVSRTITASSGSGDVPIQEQTLVYPPFATPDALAANYSKPLSSAVSYWSVSGPGGLTSGVTRKPRTVTTSTRYDDWGRITSLTDEAGTTTTSTYDATYGVLTGTVSTGKDGTVRKVVNVLTGDDKSIKSTTQSEATKGGTPSARSTTSYTYDSTGSPTSTTLAWAKGAAPPDGGGGPSSTTTTYTGTTDPTASTRSITVTSGAGTKAAQAVTTVFDLVSGQPVKVVDALGRATTTTYDAGNRQLTSTPPTGLITSTSYQPAQGGNPATRTDTEPDGHVTVTTYDPLGQISTVTDNVKDGAFSTDRTTKRTVMTMQRAIDGTKITTTDRSGRTTTTENDYLGRTVRTVLPTGLTRTTTYDDVKNTVGTALVGDGATGPSQVTTTAYDALNRQVSSRTTYPVPNSKRPLFLVDPVTQATYDGIGRTTSTTSMDLTSVPDYAGPGGTPVTTTVTPTRSNRAPGDPFTATDAAMVSGDPTRRTLQQGDLPARTGSSVTYDAAGDVSTITDALGRTTSYTYAADGQTKTRTTPSGTVTTNVYDPASGRLTSETAQDAKGATTTTAYTYVPRGQPGAGEVKTVTNESGTLTYSYDADRNPVGIAYPDGTSVTSDYADTGELLTTTDTTGAVTTYHYDAHKLLTSADQVRGGATLATVAYTYDPLGRVSTTTRGNGLVTTTTYTPNNMLDTQVTLDRAGNQVEAHDYDYDTHHNLIKQVDTTRAVSSCRRACASAATTAGTWTTTYGYDAYDRLTGSAVYAGAGTTGTPVTKIGYRLDSSGNVTTTTRTTDLAGQGPTTATTSNQLDAAGQLTGRTSTGTPTADQTFDADGRVLTSLAGTTTTYRPDGLPATVTANGATTTYSYWADGSRRSATTSGGSGPATTTTLHYRPDGTLVNDATTQGSGPSASSATASYLLTAGREARTLSSGTSSVTTGTGVGYYLRDRHNSVTSLVDSGGATTNTYSYADYGGQALLDGRPGTLPGAAPGTGAGRANPFTYTGAAAQGMYTDAGLGTMMTPTRTYDPDQGRFTSRDSANVHNRYAGFDTNPVMMSDLSGQSPLVDTIVDLLFAVVFAVAAVATGGAALGVEAGVVAADVAATAATAGSVADTIAATANVVGFVSYGTRLADDVDNAVTGTHFLTDDQRNDLNNVGTLAGGIAGVAGLVSGGAEAAAAVVDDTKVTASDLLDASSSTEGSEAGAGAGKVKPDAEAVAGGVNGPPPKLPPFSQAMFRAATKKLVGSGLLDEVPLGQSELPEQLIGSADVGWKPPFDPEADTFDDASTDVDLPENFIAVDAKGTGDHFFDFTTKPPRTDPMVTRATKRIRFDYGSKVKRLPVISSRSEEASQLRIPFGSDEPSKIVRADVAATTNHSPSPSNT